MLIDAHRCCRCSLPWSPWRGLRGGNPRCKAGPEHSKILGPNGPMGPCYQPVVSSYHVLSVISSFWKDSMVDSCRIHLRDPWGTNKIMNIRSDHIRNLIKQFWPSPLIPHTCVPQWMVLPNTLGEHWATMQTPTMMSDMCIGIIWVQYIVKFGSHNVTWSDAHWLYDAACLGLTHIDTMQIVIACRWMTDKGFVHKTLSCSPRTDYYQGVLSKFHLVEAVPYKWTGDRTASLWITKHVFLGCLVFPSVQIASLFRLSLDATVATPCRKIYHVLNMIRVFLKAFLMFNTRRHLEYGWTKLCKWLYERGSSLR